MTAASPHDVAVVGAGIVGVCCALELQAAGHRVTIYDPKPPGTATSFGNAGIIAAGSVIPYSTPDLWKSVPSMLLDPMSPLSLRWRHLPRAMPWLMRFLMAGRHGPFERITAEMAPLVREARPAHDALVAAHRIDPSLVRPSGYLMAYRNEAGFAATSLHREQLAHHKVRFEVLDQHELRQLEPGLSRDFQHALFVPDGAFVTESVALTRAYADAFTGLGGTIREATVREFTFGADGPETVITDVGSFIADRVVVAAGAWSRGLVRQLGSDAPLEAKRGYHINVPWNDETVLNRPVVVGEGQYTLCPMRDGVRVTGGVEIGGLALPPDYRRMRRMLPHARQSLPGLGAEIDREWMGHRPALPDSKPIIGPAPRRPGVFFAFGHGHLGLTLSAITARLTTELIAGRAPSVPIAPFRIDRF